MTKICNRSDLPLRHSLELISTLKRERLDSSGSAGSSSHSSTDPSPLDLLHQHCFNSTKEDFHPPRPSSIDQGRISSSCPICKRSIRRSARISLQCDRCPLIYHLDCLISSKNPYPKFNQSWICPNHHERISMKKSVRVKLLHRTLNNETKQILQHFHLSPKKISSNVEISRIPPSIEQFYAKENPPRMSFDPSIVAIIDDILHHVIDGEIYPTSPSNSLTPSTIDSFDRLVKALNEPDQSSNLQINPRESHSFFIDLCQFRSSHAALIHLPSNNVIYLRKSVIWFGLSSNMDIDLTRYASSSTVPCSYLSERHACLYYDRKENRFELLNYSEFGTIVNGIRYGIDEEEFDPFDGCCSCRQLASSAWNGPAPIDQGSRFHLGCHEFVFYRSD